MRRQNHPDRRGPRAALLPVTVLILLLAPLKGHALWEPGSTAVQQTEEASPEQPEDPDVPLKAFLLTAEPGDFVWELFGHNALLIRDTLRGVDAAYNYGLFDFQSSDFVTRFLRGTMMYQVAPVRLDAMMASYAGANRKLWAQELDLEPAEVAELSRLLAEASLPENRFYRYEYFLNNCSTKLRDVLNQVLGGQVLAESETVSSGKTWRDHTRRLTVPSWWGFAGIELLLGPKGDELTSEWAEMWVPEELRRTMAATNVVREDGTTRPLVKAEHLWVDSDRTPSVASAPGFNLLFPVIGLALSALLLFASRGTASNWSIPTRLTLTSVVLAWSWVSALAGFLFVAVHWTDHEFMYWNQNVLLFSPFAIVLGTAGIVAIWKSQTGKAVRRTATVILALSGLAIAGWILPAVGQSNAEWLALAVPVNVALWTLFSRRIPSKDAPPLI